MSTDNRRLCNNLYFIPIFRASLLGTERATGWQAGRRKLNSSKELLIRQETFCSVRWSYSWERGVPISYRKSQEHALPRGQQCVADVATKGFIPLFYLPRNGLLDIAGDFAQCLVYLVSPFPTCLSTADSDKGEVRFLEGNHRYMPRAQQCVT